MTQLHKYWIQAAMGGLLLILLPQAGWGQIPFTVTSTPRMVRSQGITEAAGDIIFTATGVGTTVAQVAITIQVQPSINITSNPTISSVLAPFSTVGVIFGDKLGFIIPAGTTFEVGTQIRVRGLRLNVAAAGLGFSAGITAQITLDPAVELV